MKIVQLDDANLLNTAPIVRKPENLALRTANKIERSAIVNPHMLGCVLATEGDLAQQFGVGQSAVREAIRILQFRGSISMRKGQHGGLIVAVPLLEQVACRAVGQLYLTRPAPIQVCRARLVLSSAAVTLRTRNVSAHVQPGLPREVRDSSKIEEISAARESSKFVAALAQRSGNLALALFTRILEIIGHGFADGATAEDGTTEKWARVVESSIDAAVLRGDQLAARELVTIYHRRIDSGMEVADGSRFAVPQHKRDLLNHRATRLAREIVVRILTENFESGRRFGSEEDICVMLNARRAPVRQALRILAADGIVVIRPGRGKGIFVATPSQDAIASPICNYLRATGLPRWQAQQLLSIVREWPARTSQCDVLAENPMLRLLAQVLEAVR